MSRTCEAPGEAGAAGEAKQLEALNLGNSPDPLDLIAQYSADALRFGVMRSAPLGQDVLFDEQHVALGRNFCTKLWNACRFRQMQGGATESEIDPARLNSDDKWILLRLNRAIRELTDSLADYRFTEATQTLHRFFWSEFCDWYLEASKPVLQGDDAGRKGNTLAVTDFILSHVLRLFHPYLPFITEELWHGLGYHADMPGDQGGDTIQFAPWPKVFDERFLQHYGLDESDERFVASKFEMVTMGRNLRGENRIASNKKVRFVFYANHALEPHDLEVIQSLLNAESLEVNPAERPHKGTPMVVTPLGELFLPLDGLVDIEAEVARLTKEIGKTDQEIVKVKSKLDNPGFRDKVPPEVLQAHQQRLVDWEEKRRRLQSSLDGLGED